MSERTNRPGRADERLAVWMRSVSFTGLHRMLHAAASAPNRRTTALGLNELVIQKGLSLTARARTPAPTTFYHYPTLLRLGALRRDGRHLCVNDEDPRVRTLLDEPASTAGGDLSDNAKGGFAALVLDNADCRSLFFDLFMPRADVAVSIRVFRRSGLPVQWRRDGPAKAREVVFHPLQPDRIVRYSSPGEISAILYGLRYWRGYGGGMSWG